MKYIIGNWKSHKNRSEIELWAQGWKQLKVPISDQVWVVVCAPLIGLPVLQELLPKLSLGAQVLSPFSDGAYTGAVSARMVKEYASFALLGHVERRKNFGETDQSVAQQVLQALDNEIVPIVAVSDANWAQQLSQFDNQQLLKILVMYEPPEAISTSSGGGHAADVDAVKVAVSQIKSEFKVKGVLYGGSVNPENVARFMQEDSIDGVVPGAASLDPSSFAALVEASL